jgi:DNA-binding LytR/AlgR family response regulator
MITAIALDDEPLALQIITQYCNKINGIKLVKTFTNPIETYDFLKNEKVDLLFLDIQMPDINGLSFYNNLTVKPKVIFTTAFKDYAVDGFNVNAIDYLLKPFEFERFLTAVTKATKQNENQTTPSDGLNYINVKVNYEIQKINLAEIDLIESLDDYIKIHIKPYPILTLMTLKNMLEKLPESEFIRIHRSYIIPFNKVEKFNKQKVVVAGKEIPIGGSYSTVFNKIAEYNSKI